MKPDEHQHHHKLDRANSSCRSTRKILPSSLNHCTTSSSISSSSSLSSSSSSSSSSINPEYSNSDDTSGHQKPLVAKPPATSLFHLSNLNKPRNLANILRSLLATVSLPTCRWLRLSSPSFAAAGATTLGRTVTGTLFGHKKGHVSFAVQYDPRSDPVLLLELATSTCTLVKEMASGLVRIALECKSGSGGSSGSTRPVKLFQEPMWTMYCNGKKCGYAGSRTCGEWDWHVLSTVQTVSVGAGVIPVEKVNGVGTGLDAGSGGEVMYMRARFERVVGNRDSEAFYMMNPDGTGGPELSIFLLRI